MTDYNLERYSDKVWQGGRKFGREQAIDEMPEIIGRYEESENIYSQKDLDEEREAVIDRVLEIIDSAHAHWIDTEHGSVYMIEREMLREAVKELKGGEHESSN